jgi:hypothetical protein
METVIKKCVFNGWKAETQVPLADVDGTPVSLEISTLKRSNGAISSHATRYLKTDGGKSFVVFEDFSKPVGKPSLLRATEKKR